MLKGHLLLCSKYVIAQRWSRQPLHGTLPQGNFQLVAGILFSGSSAVKVINMLKHITVYLIQSHDLIPTVFLVWNSEQQQIFEKLSFFGEKVIHLGDGRCDSSGYSYR